MAKKIKISAKNFKIVLKKFKIVPKKFKKITNQVYWILSKRVCDVITMFIASTKTPKHEGSISPSSMSNCLTISHMSFSLIYPVDEFFLKKMRTWGQSKISSYCFFVWCKSRELEGRRSSRFPCLTAVVGTFSERVAFRTL